MHLAQAANTTAPWWSTALVTAIATIVGGLITVGANWAIEWRKSKRQDAAKWDKDILDLAGQFIKTANQLENPALFRGKYLEKDYREKLDANQTVLEITELIQKLEIVAPALGDPARKVFDTTLACFLAPLDEHDNHSQRWLAMAEARDVFSSATSKVLKAIGSN